MSAPMANVTAEERKWRAESDLETLIRAAEIKNDKERMAAARKCAQKRLKAINTVV